MSLTGDCGDNAVAKSFSATLKGELVDNESDAEGRAVLRGSRQRPGVGPVGVVVPLDSVRRPSYACPAPISSPA